MSIHHENPTSSSTEDWGLEPVMDDHEWASYLIIPISTVYDRRVHGKGPAAYWFGKHLQFAVAGYVVGIFFPELSAEQVTGLIGDGTADQIAPLLGNVQFLARAILINNVRNVGAVIEVPTLVAPFAGIANFGQKVAEIGLTLSASGSELWGAILPSWTPAVPLAVPAHGRASGHRRALRGGQVNLR